jgi:hypothetical protein
LLRFGSAFAAPLLRFGGALVALLRRLCSAFAAPLQRLCGAFAVPLLRLYCAFAALLLCLCGVFIGAPSGQLLLYSVQLTSMASTKLLASTKLFFGVEVKCARAAHNSGRTARHGCRSYPWLFSKGIDYHGQTDSHR